MIISKTVKIKWGTRVKKHFIEKGYEFTKIDDEFEVKVEDLPRGSGIKIKYLCDYCLGKNQTEEKSKYKIYNNLIKNRKIINKDCCNNAECIFLKINETKPIIGIPNEKSFVVNYPHLLNEWNYDKNKKSPNEYTLGSSKKVWWICAEGHEWEIAISHRTRRKSKCPYCTRQKVNNENCFENTHGELASQWNYSKNGDITPKDVLSGTIKKYWWICDKGHEWESSINNRVHGYNCPYCAHQKMTVEESFGTLQTELMIEWNFQKNKNLNPYTLASGSNKKVWWVCSICKHEWKTSINHRTSGSKTGCPLCKESKGEKRVAEILLLNKIKFQPQFEFNNLLGVGGKNLKFDFAIFDYNGNLIFLIEYDGEFHFEKQFENDNSETIQIHDEFKNSYCKENDIPLLRIPYWNFDNIEDILIKELTDYGLL